VQAENNSKTVTWCRLWLNMDPTSFFETKGSLNKGIKIEANTMKYFKKDRKISYLRYTLMT
jgi:hypothetical protein